MNTPDTRLDAATVEDDLPSPRLAGTRKMPQAPRASATTIVAVCETAGAYDASRNTWALGAADLLCLAAAPTFAIMALLTCILGGGTADMLCADASPFGGMVPMYLLMSAFHATPWLRLMSGRRGSSGS